VQLDPIKPTLKAPGTKRLKLKYDGPVLNFAFEFNLRLYTMVCFDIFILRVIPPVFFTVGPARCCSPRHKMLFYSRNEGSQCVSMTRRAMGLADVARDVIACHLT